MPPLPHIQPQPSDGITIPTEYQMPPSYCHACSLQSAHHATNIFSTEGEDALFDRISAKAHTEQYTTPSAVYQFHHTVVTEYHIRNELKNIDVTSPALPMG
jgi:hypothetical protein